MIEKTTAIKIKEEDADTKSEVEEIVNTPKRFLVETLTGIAIFLIIAGAAVGLSYIVTILEKNGVDMVVVVGLRVAEYSIFAVDLILLGRFLWITGIKTWRSL